MDAPDLGVSALQCASGAAADGTSNPPIGAGGRQPARARAHGSTSTTRRWPGGRYFTAWPRRRACRRARRRRFDAAYLRHQLPGGVVGTMRRHLDEARLTHMEGAVIEELGQVREELGWPIVMTPFAQMI